MWIMAFSFDSAYRLISDGTVSGQQLRQQFRVTAISGDSNFGLGVVSGPIANKINGKLPAQTYPVKIENPISLSPQIDLIVVNLSIYLWC